MNPPLPSLHPFSAAQSPALGGALQPVFERGLHQPSEGEPIWVIRLSPGMIAPSRHSDGPAWAEADLYSSKVHRRCPVIGRWQGRSVLLSLVRHAQAKAAGWPGTRHWLLQADSPELDLLITAVSLAAWEEQHQFCGRCGAATQARYDEYAKECPRCRLRQYPRISPSMICLVWREEELLLAQSPRFQNGMYSLLAGFVEAGESVEEAVHREVKEEVGIEIQRLHYLGSQSWPFPHSLMLGYWAEYHQGEIQVDPTELVDARWFHWQDLPLLPPPASIARRLIDQFVEWRRHAAED
ncbi:NAD(+) diphosphatase [Marinospirillum sp. MEB164]|uniref:NAD-capped RNA hydrolase NudC n=1 Tax=Marinospirillum alkalitolerans TaxID=3123374 RepID=A0ABW8PZQ8_9GAMM